MGQEGKGGEGEDGEFLKIHQGKEKPWMEMSIGTTLLKLLLISRVRYLEAG